MWLNFLNRTKFGQVLKILNIDLKQDGSGALGHIHNTPIVVQRVAGECGRVLGPLESIQGTIEIFQTNEIHKDGMLLVQKEPNRFVEVIQQRVVLDENIDRDCSLNNSMSIFSAKTTRCCITSTNLFGLKSMSAFLY